MILVVVVVGGGGGGRLWGWWLLWLSFYFLLWGLILGWVLIVVVAVFLGVILVVKNWSLWLSFGRRWMCGFTGEREKGREEREESDLFILFNVVVYIILISCMEK